MSTDRALEAAGLIVAAADAQATRHAGDPAYEFARRIVDAFGGDDVVRIARALLALSAEVERMRWQPIESAPRDGTSIDVWVGGEFPRRATDVSWRTPTDSEWWVHGGDILEEPRAAWFDGFGPLGRDNAPTHWRHLPTPPSSQPGNSEVTR